MTLPPIPANRTECCSSVKVRTMTEKAWSLLQTELEVPRPLGETEMHSLKVRRPPLNVSSLFDAPKTERAAIEKQCQSVFLEKKVKML